MKDIPTSNAEYFSLARTVMPGGISHRYRWKTPNPIYVDRAKGAYKWDIEGRRYIDFKMGSASQMLGHCHPEITAALQQQAGRLLLAADCHPLEVQWAAQVCNMIPGIERARFVASGTEASMLAIRMARAVTGRDRILRVDAHYHGWHDHVMRGTNAGSNRPASLGVPQAIEDLTLVCAANREAIDQAIAETPDLAAIIVEASGASYGAVPMSEDALHAARSAADRVGAVFILDEVITGFRWSPGGRQALAGVTPDITTLAKIATGGMPGGIVGGSEDIMAVLDPSVDTRGMKPGVLHQGTFNGAPIVAAAAVVMLDHLADGTAQAHADRVARLLREGITAIMFERGIAGVCYGDSSTFHLYFGDAFDGTQEVPATVLRGFDATRAAALGRALNARGVDLMSAMSGVTSLAHTEADVEEALAAFDGALGQLQEEGHFG